MYAEEIKSDWNYNVDFETQRGPASWGKLDTTFRLCGVNESSQSPINLASFRIASADAPSVYPLYNAGPLLVRNTGNYIRLIPNKGSLLFYGDRVYDLVFGQIKLPSEHDIAGENFPLELQLVHKGQSDDELAVVSLLYKQGLSNPFLSRILESTPALAHTEDLIDEAVDLSLAAPKDITQYNAGTRVSFPHYTYIGSLSTPPCTPNVRWFVWSKPDRVSKDQIDAFQRLFQVPPSRPTQDMNSRIVELKSLF